MLRGAAPCCAVLGRAAQCWAVLRGAAPRGAGTCAVLGCAARCWAVLRSAGPCCAVLGAVLRGAGPCCAVLRRGGRCWAVLRGVRPCCAVLRRAVFSTPSRVFLTRFFFKNICRAVLMRWVRGLMCLNVHTWERDKIIYFAYRYHIYITHSSTDTEHARDEIII